MRQENRTEESQAPSHRGTNGGYHGISVEWGWMKANRSPLGISAGSGIFLPRQYNFAVSGSQGRGHSSFKYHEYSEMKAFTATRHCAHDLCGTSNRHETRRGLRGAHTSSAPILHHVRSSGCPSINRGVFRARRRQYPIRSPLLQTQGFLLRLSGRHPEPQRSAGWGPITKTAHRSYDSCALPVVLGMWPV